MHRLVKATQRIFVVRAADISLPTAQSKMSAPAVVNNGVREGQALQAI